MSKNSLLTGLILLTLILPLSNATTDPWFELDTDEDGFKNGIDLCPNIPSSSNEFNQTTCSHTNHWVRQNGVEIHHRIGVGEGFEFEISPDQKYLAFKDNEYENSVFDILMIDDMSDSLKEGQFKAKSFVFSKNSSVMYTTDGTYISIFELNNSIWSLRGSQFDIDLRHLCVSWQCIGQMEMTENGSHILLTTMDVYDEHRYCGFAMLNIMSFQIDMNYNLSNSTRQFACNNAPFISSTVNGSLVFSISGGSGIEIHDLTGSKNTSIILENTSNSDGIIAHSTNGKLFAHVADGPPGTFQKSIQIRHLNNLTLVSELYIHNSELGYFEFSPDSTNLIIHADAYSDNARFMITSNGSMMFTDSFHNLTFFDIYKNTTTTFSPGDKSGTHPLVVFGADRDNDMVADINDAFPNDPFEWSDSDSDNVGDNADAFPNDPTESTDADSDGVGDYGDIFPNDSTESTDRDGDGIGDNSDHCPSSTSNVGIDQFGCFWYDEDYDGDGIVNGLDICPTVARLDCGYNGINFTLGLRKTTGDMINITNHIESFYSLSDINHLYVSVLECDRAGTLGELKLVELTIDCTEYDNGHLYGFNATDTLIATNQEQQTGDWATEYDTLYVPWGNYTPESYCCWERLDTDYQPEIWPLEVSSKGDLVIWTELHLESNQYWAWYENSEPVQVFNQSHTMASEKSAGAFISLSHDSRYLVISNGWQTHSFRNYIVDLETQNVVMEFDCESHTIAYKSNTIACYDSGNLTLFSIEKNSIQSITKLDYETTPFMHFSPSDNHLLVYEHEGESLQIFDLQANENLTISIDVKEGFESPKVSNAGFYLTDETFYAHIKYEKLERHPSAWHLDENEILIFGIDYDSDGVISLFDTCQNTPPLTNVDFNGCLQIDGIGDNIDLDDNDNGINDSDENRTTNSDDFLIGIFGCLIPLLICSSIILHKPTFNKTVTLIGKLPGTEGLVDVLEEQRNRLDERENPLDSIDTMEGFLGILVGIFVAPWILIAYALPFLLTIVFAAVMLYLIISAGVLFLLGSAACLIFLIPFLLLGSLTG